MIATSNLKGLSQAVRSTRVLEFFSELGIEDFERDLGGLVYVCEVPEDLLDIPCGYPDSRGKNITNTINSWDVAEIIQDTSWAVFHKVTNNAGGDVYLIQQRLWPFFNLEAQLNSLHEDNSHLDSNG